MKNTQNFTVENIVAKYRNYVKENCPKTKVIDEIGEYEIPSTPNANADEQLLVTLYTTVAGTDADKKVLSVLSNYAEKFYEEVLSKEEISFLCLNFVESVDLLMQHLIERRKENVIHQQTPRQIIDIILESIHIKEGMSIFVAGSGYGEVASLFPNCNVKGYTSHDKYGDEEVWALAQIRLFANGVNSMIQNGYEGCAEVSYIEDIDFVLWGTDFLSSYDDVEIIYRQLKPGSQMILFMEEYDAAGSNNDTFNIRKSIVDEHSIKSITSYEYNTPYLGGATNGVAILVEKSTHDIVHVHNGSTGEIFEIPSSVLDCKLLWPSFYNTKRSEFGIPLSDIVSLAHLNTIKVIKNNGDWALPEDIKQIPVAFPTKMGKEYKDANLLDQELDLAGNPAFDDMWKFHVELIKEPCVLLFGNKEKTVVGYINEIPKSGIATITPVVCLVPKEGIDVRYIAALLLTPEVKNQIVSICHSDINWRSFPFIIDKVLVPNHSERERLSFLSEANYEALNSLRVSMKKTFDEKYEAMKCDYINEVRMRKHDMGQKVFDLINTEDLMRYYVENRETESDLWPLIEEQLDHLRSTIYVLSEMLNHLSQEDQFGTPELINLDEYLTSLQHSNIINGFKLSYQLDRDSILGYHLSGMCIDDGRDHIHDLAQPTVFVSKNDFQRVVSNILNNAQKHGFIDSERKDYEVIIGLSFNLTKGMYQIDFRNNGQPLPEGLNKMRYGIKGEKAGQTAGMGIGGSVVKSIVEHYKGEYDVFMDREWVVIRILLPNAI